MADPDPDELSDPDCDAEEDPEVDEAVPVNIVTSPLDVAVALVDAGPLLDPPEPVDAEPPTTSSANIPPIGTSQLKTHHPTCPPPPSQ